MQYHDPTEKRMHLVWTFHRYPKTIEEETESSSDK
jgi:hypothetical protein